jgi:phage-related protein
MSAIAPKTSMASPSQSSSLEKVFKSNRAAASEGTRDLILEIIVLTGAAMAIVIVTYLVFKPLFTGLFGTVTDTIGNITDITSDALNTITDVIGGTIEEASSIVTSVVNTTNIIINGIGDAINTSISTATGIVNTVGSGINTTISTLTSTTTSLMGTITGSFNELMGLQQGIISGIVSVTNDAIEGFKTILETASTEFQNLISTLRSAGESIIQSVQDGIRFIIDPFINETYGIPAIANLMLGTISTITGGITSLADNIKNGLEALVETIDGLI